MRTPSWFTMALLAVGTVVVVGCAPTAAVPTPRPDNHCFVEVPVVPGETDQQGVTALWGQPDEVFPSTQGDSWLYYAPAPLLSEVLLQFRGGRVKEVFVAASECDLGDIVGRLGPPEIVEVMYSEKMEPPFSPETWLHYPSRGESYCIPCLEPDFEICSTFDPEEEVDGKQVYPPTTVERFRQERWFHGTYIDWPGFSQ